jgi:hypothetical protein
MPFLASNSRRSASENWAKRGRKSNQVEILTQNAPAGTQANDLLLVDGSSGVAASSLLGVEYHQVDSNSGTWLVAPGRNAAR